jgi:hypothetical protein
MLTELPEKWIIRTSDRGTFKRCRQLWEYKSPLRQRWSPIEAPKPLEFGIAVHAGLEVYYEPDLWSLPDRSVRENLAYAAFTEECQKQIKRRKEMNFWDTEAEEDFKEREELGRGMLEHYFMWSPEVDAEAGWKPVLSEVEFEVPVPAPRGTIDHPGFSADKDGQLHYLDRPVVYQGRIDLIIEKDDGYWIVDHKTAAQFADTAHLNMDEQCGSYFWAASVMLGLDIRGVIYSELRKKVPKPARALKNGGFSKDKSQDTTYHHYLRTLEGADEPLLQYKEFLAMLREKPNTFFRRTEVYRSQRELKLLAERIGLEAIDMLGDPLIYPTPNRFNCNGCSFYAPCLSKWDGSDELFHLEARFTKEG